MHKTVINLFASKVVIQMVYSRIGTDSMVDRKGSECIVRELAVTASLIIESLITYLMKHE